MTGNADILPMSPLVFLSRIAAGIQSNQVMLAMSKACQCVMVMATPSLWRGCGFQPCQVKHGLFFMVSAHVVGGLQTSAHSGTLRVSENFTCQIFIKLYARHAGGFAIRHTRYGAADGRRYAAGGA